MDQGTLGSLARLDKSTAAPLLGRLRRRGLVEITKDSADRRRKLVTVTEEGAELATGLAPAAATVSEQLPALPAPGDREELLRLPRRTLDDED
nr:MarR family winged helix-turn-helix transcriptional regulator [Streptomyces sp. SID8379]